MLISLLACTPSSASSWRLKRWKHWDLQTLEINFEKHNIHYIIIHYYHYYKQLVLNY